jgi:2Fe-2S ferredoxin
VPRITFVEPSGLRREVDAPIGITLKDAAMQNGVQGILALCGGACACGTCHVYVGAAWLPKLQAREEMEEGMLECAWEPRGNSRLSCQIHVTADLEGLEVTVPQRQGAT